MAKEENDIEHLVDQIRTDFGDDAVRFGEGGVIKRCDAISTRCLSLDAALGVGGLPRGRIAEIYGPESSGKTTLAMTVVAEAQASGLHAAYIDAEHAVDPEYAINIGVDMRKLLFSQPDSGQQALQIVEKCVDSGIVGVVVVDSVAALVPKEELEGAMDDVQVGAQARMMSKALRMLKGSVRRSNTCLLFINQIREKIRSFGHGDPTVTPGGRALKFYASVRLDIRRIGSMKDSGSESGFSGNKTKVKVVKNKVAPPFRTAEFVILFNHGISSEGDLLDLGLKHKVIQRRGTSFSIGEQKLGMGWMNAVKFLSGAQEVRDGLRKLLEAKVLPKTIDEAGGEDVLVGMELEPGE